MVQAVCDTNKSAFTERLLLKWPILIKIFSLPAPPASSVSILLKGFFGKIESVILSASTT